MLLELGNEGSDLVSERRWLDADIESKPYVDLDLSHD